MRDKLPVIGAVIAGLIGLGRGFGGISLLSHHPSLGGVIVGLGLLVVAIILVVSSAGFLMAQSRRKRVWITVGMLLYWVGGAVNGYILYGHPQAVGQIINLTLLIIVLICLWIGRMKSTK